jgi:hypothetical protein
MVEGPKATITTASDNNITTIYTQCTQGPHGPGPYQPIEGYVKQVGGHCELRCEVSTNASAAAAAAHSFRLWRLPPMLLLLHYVMSGQLPRQHQHLLAVNPTL